MNDMMMTTHAAAACQQPGARRAAARASGFLVLHAPARGMPRKLSR